MHVNGNVPIDRANPFCRERGSLALVPEKRAFGGPFGAQQFGIGTLFGLRLNLGGSEAIEFPYEQNQWVYACLRARSKDVASVPLKIWQSDDEDAEEVAESDPVRLLFARPNAHWSFARVLEAAILHRELSGEDLWFLTGIDGKPLPVSEIDDRIPLPSALYPIMGGDNVTMTPNPVTGFPASWKFGTSPAFDARSVIQFATYDPRRPTRGLGGVQALARILDIQFQAERFQEALLRNSGDPGGWLELDHATPETERKRFEEEINAALKQPEVAGRIAVFEKGAKYTPNPQMSKEMSFGVLLNTIRDTICAVLGVPLPIIGVLDQATYSNYEQATRAYWQTTIIADLSLIEETLNAMFFPRLKDGRQSKYRCYFDRGAIEALRRDQTEKIKSAAVIAAQRVGMSFGGSLQVLGVDIDPDTDLPPEALEVLAPLEAMPMDVPTDDSMDVSGDVTPAPAAVDPAAKEVTASGQLNGAQISAAIDVVSQVTAGKLPRDSGVAILINFFGLSPETAETVMGTAGTKEPTTPNPGPASDPKPPPFGGAPPKPDEPPPPKPPKDPPPEPDPAPEDDEAKAAAIRRDAQAPVILDRAATTPEERAAYWADVEHRIHRPSTIGIKAAVLKWIRAYELAQRKRLESFARTGKAFKGWKPVSPEDRASLASARVVREISDADVERFLLLNEKEWKDKLASVTRAPITDAWRTAAQDVARELGESFIPMNDPRVVRYLAAQQLQLSGVADTFAEQVKRRLLKVFASADPSTIATLQQAVLENLPALDDEVADVFKARNARALMIARTETGRAADGARYAEYQDKGIEETEWISSRDDAVRESHQEIDGDTQPLGQTFIPGDQLAFPHDPNADPSQTINCRCIARAVRTNESDQ